jgi:hypothetical protein
MTWIKSGAAMQACKRLLPLSATPAFLPRKSEPGDQRSSPPILPALGMAFSNRPFRTFMPIRSMFTKCMEEEGEDAAAPLTERKIFDAMKAQYYALPQASTATLKDLRTLTARALGLPETGLDGKAAIIKKMASAHINGEEVSFDASDCFKPPEPAVPVPMTSARAREASAGLVPRKIPKGPIFVPYSEPRIGIEDLSIREWHGQNPIKTVVDIIRNHEADITESDVKKCIVTSTYEQLPAIVRPPATAVPVNHHIQSALIPLGGRRWNIVNFITFQSDGPDGKVLPATAKSYERGEMHLINYGACSKVGKRVFLHLFEELGGFQVRYYELQTNSQSASESTACSDELAAIDRGFDFLEKAWKERSVAATGMKQVQWIIRNIKDEASPIFGQGAFKWTDRLVREALRSLRDEGVLAKVVATNPYTIKTFAPWFVDEVLVKLLPHLKTKSLGLVGRSGVGKTPVMEGVATIFSRFWRRELGIEGPGVYRTATDLDFFRGEVGTTHELHIWIDIFLIFGFLFCLDAAHSRVHYAVSILCHLIRSRITEKDTILGFQIGLICFITV